MNAIGLNRESALTDLDWIVVAIARMDGALSINPEGRLARFLRSFFGWPVAGALANERVETLRRFCVRVWHWDFIRDADVRKLTEAGYSAADIQRILAHVAGSRGFARSLREAAT